MQCKNGYSETNASRNHDGLCISCYVKSLVKTKINAANNTKQPTNARSLDHLFEKFESITLTSETAPNLRVKKRFGIVHGEATLTGTPHGNCEDRNGGAPPSGRRAVEQLEQGVPKCARAKQPDAAHRSNLV